MRKKPREPSASGASGLSRRRILQASALTACGAAVLVGVVTPAEAKMTEAAATYRDKPNGNQSCASCAFFKPPSSCVLVDGTISPKGWCRFYSKKS